MGLFTSIRNFQKTGIYGIISAICVVITVWSPLSYGLHLLNWIPDYDFEGHRTNSITPIINLFPGQKVRLDIKPHGPFNEQNVKSAKWTITKDSHHFDVDGLKPTIKLPPTTGGIYQLEVEANTLDGEIKKGESTFYVVQDTPKTITFNTATQVKLALQNTSPPLLKAIQSEGLQIYSHNQWIDAKNVSATSNVLTFTLEPNESISMYGDERQIFFRVKNEKTKLSSYDTAHFLSDSGEKRNKDEH